MRNAISSREHTQWETPPEFLQWIQQTYLTTPTVIDLAATANNTKFPTWLGPGGQHENALAVDWKDVFDTHKNQYGYAEGFCNPPWHMIPQFLAKTKGLKYWVTWVLPARVEAKWGKLLWELAHSIYFVTPRVNYMHPETKMIQSGIACGTIIACTRGNSRFSWRKDSPSVHRVDWKAK